MQKRIWIIALAATIGLSACDDIPDSSSGYDGCHGVGCLVDDPDTTLDPTLDPGDPQYWPICSDGVRYPDCSFAPDGY